LRGFKRSGGVSTGMRRWRFEALEPAIGRV
jgi:hypothetical protein